MHWFILNYFTTNGKAIIYVDGHGTLQKYKYRGAGTRYFAKISTAVPVLSN